MTSIWKSLAAISIIGGLSSVIDYCSGEFGDANADLNRQTLVEHAALITAELTGDDGTDTWKSFEEMHEVYTQAFVESEGFGMSRILTFDEPSRRSLFVNGVAHRVAGMELIGLIQQEPVAYISNWMNVTRKQLQVYEQRNLTEFEHGALAGLKQGSPHVWLPPATASMHVTNIRNNSKSVHPQAADARAVDQKYSETNGTLIAGLTATNTCTLCHNVPEGTLLGAFIYKMEPQQQLNTLAELLQNSAHESSALLDDESVPLD